MTAERPPVFVLEEKGREERLGVHPVISREVQLTVLLLFVLRTTEKNMSAARRGGGYYYRSQDY